MSFSLAIDSFHRISCRLDENCIIDLCFRKTRKKDNFREFSAFVPTGIPFALNECISEKVKETFEKAHPYLKNAVQFQLESDRIYVTLNRTTMFQLGLKEYICSEANETNVSYFEQPISVHCDTEEDSAVSWRCRNVADILGRVLKANSRCRSEENYKFLVSNRNAFQHEPVKTIFIGPVFCFNSSTNKETVVSISECRKVFANEISIMSKHRLESDCQFPDTDLNVLVKASLLFAMIGANISKRVTLKFDSNVAQTCKAAVFVLYNYCRMIHVIRKYRNLEKDGTYPPLPELESTNFQLLTKTGEWDLMFNFVLYWPNILKSTVSDIGRGDFKIHKVVQFLKSLSSEFSAYYRRTRILTLVTLHVIWLVCISKQELFVVSKMFRFWVFQAPRPNLLPYLHARIYLILGLMQIYGDALNIIGLCPIQNM